MKILDYPEIIMPIIFILFTVGIYFSIPKKSSIQRNADANERIATALESIAASVTNEPSQMHFGDSWPR